MLTCPESRYKYPVFYTAPPGCLILSLVVAILAAIVASQAIITATFQLLSQIIKLSYFPQIKVIHTSKVFHNQLYVPLVNYLMLIGTVVVTAVFRNTTSLGQAYGVCVMFVSKSRQLENLDRSRSLNAHSILRYDIDYSYGTYSMETSTMDDIATLAHIRMP